MFNNEDLTIDLWVDPPLLNALFEDARSIANKLNLTSVMNEVNELKAKVSSRISPIPNVSGSRYFAYAIDSSFPPSPLELVGGVLTVVAYGYVGQVGGKSDRYVTGDILYEDTSEISKSIEIISKIREREMAMKLLKDKLHGRKNLDLIILDGEIYVHPLPYNLPAYEGVRRKVEDVLEKMLNLAEKSKTTIVGVVKRVRSRYLSIYAGHCLSTNDKLMASLLLNKGEYISLGNYGSVLPQWLQINYMDCETKRGMSREEAERRLNEGIENLKRVFNGDGGRLKGIPKVADTELIFYKAPITAVATKLEVLDLGGIGVPNLVGYLSSQTTNTGYPYLLDLVDTYVRVDSRLLDYVKSLLTRYAGLSISDSNVKELINTLLQLTNPQKAYLYRQMEG
ncbi:DNA double-strand break repair nuclease NurA [Caldivirga sp.]|uniref:DNA double-strand break repair nuclease NurA n=1 Tax=Caldivirga sp. TaxID=2080243 RepID=UPI003D0CC247